MKITITGPRSVGKSTISKIVAKKLGFVYISSDLIGEEAFKEHGGLDKAIKSGKAEELIKNGSYNLILEIYDKKDNFVFDLSGGAFSSDRLGEASEKVRNKAKENSIIFGLLPDKDNEKSIKLLFAREKNREHFKNFSEKDLMEKTIRSYNRFPPIFENYCNFVVYTKDKSPEKISDEIIEKLKRIS